MRSSILIYILSLVILSCSPATRDHQTNYAKTANVVQFRLVDDANQDGLEAMIVQDTGKELFLRQQVLLNLDDVSHAHVNLFRNTYQIRLLFTRTGKWKFSEITGSNVGKRLGVLFDGNLLSALRINQQIDSGWIPLFFNLTASKANELTSRINTILASLPRVGQEAPGSGII